MQRRRLTVRRARAAVPRCSRSRDSGRAETVHCVHAVYLTLARVACSFDIHRLLFPVRSASAAARDAAGRSPARPSALRRTRPRHPRPPVAAASAGGERAAPQHAPSHSKATTSCPAVERCWTAAGRWRWLTAAAAVVAVSHMALLAASPVVYICVYVSPLGLCDVRVCVCVRCSAAVCVCGQQKWREMERLVGLQRSVTERERERERVRVRVCHCCSIDEEHCHSLRPATLGPDHPHRTAHSAPPPAQRRPFFR